MCNLVFSPKLELSRTLNFFSSRSFSRSSSSSSFLRLTFPLLPHLPTLLPPTCHSSLGSAPLFIFFRLLMFPYPELSSPSFSSSCLSSLYSACCSSFSSVSTSIAFSQTLRVCFVNLLICSSAPHLFYFSSSSSRPPPSPPPRHCLPTFSIATSATFDEATEEHFHKSAFYDSDINNITLRINTRKYSSRRSQWISTG